MLGTSTQRKYFSLSSIAGVKTRTYVLTLPGILFWQPRDLRKIDSRIPNLVPTILVRKEAFLVCVNCPFYNDDGTALRDMRPHYSL